MPVLNRLSVALRGFTLIELTIALAISALIAAIGYPSYAEHVRKAKRVDAITRLAMLQQAQERWRTNHAEYGTLNQIGVAAETSEALHRLSIADADGNGYIAVAEALGTQAVGACRYLQLTVVGGNVARTSGPDAAVGNDNATNRNCWIR